MIEIRPFNINDASTILSWCKDKHAFRLWSADRYKEFPAQPEEMMEQYTGEKFVSAHGYRGRGNRRAYPIEIPLRG